MSESSYLTTFGHTGVSDWIKTWSIMHPTISSGTLEQSSQAMRLREYQRDYSKLDLVCLNVIHLNVIVHCWSFLPLSLSLFHCFTVLLMTCSWWGWVNICKNLRCQNQNAHVQIHFAVLNDNVVLVKRATLTITYFLSIYSSMGERGACRLRAPPPLTLQKIASVSWRSDQT